MADFIPILLIIPSIKLFCILLPCAALLISMGVYVGSVLSRIHNVTYTKMNEFVKNASF